MHRALSQSAGHGAAGGDEKAEPRQAAPADESVSTEYSLVEIIRRRAATVVQTKIAKNGGIYRVNRLWRPFRCLR